MCQPTLTNERSLRAQGFLVVAGVDEVGRGCVAGPVVAAAVVLPADSRLFSEDANLGRLELPQWLGDSKKVSPKRRLVAAERIKELAVAWSVGLVEADQIDALGIVGATQLAMKRAVDSLAVVPDFLLVDGWPHPDFAAEAQLGQPKADATIASVSAASIVAKVYRDGLMTELDAVYPGYNLAGNKGYGTASHMAAIGQLGLSDVHRKSFLKGVG